MLSRVLAAGCLLAQVASAATAAAGATVDLRSAAAASPRPAECSASAETTSSLDWEQARLSTQRRYCRALALGYARLPHAPALALDQADHAGRMLPGQAAPKVLAARAQLRLGKPEAAARSFEQATRLDRHAIKSPQALHDLALATAALGQADKAVAAYRSLVPRLGAVPDPVLRTRIYVEAAVHLMAAEPKALTESIGYLNEARRKEVPPGLRPYVASALALALHRAGREQQAFGVAAESLGALPLLRHLERQLEQSASAKPPWLERLPVLPVAELRAMAAMLAERELPELALEHWEAIVNDGGGNPWANHARAARERVARQSQSGRAR